jgi:hypothetical protein
VAKACACTRPLFITTYTVLSSRSRQSSKRLEQSPWSTAAQRLHGTASKTSTSSPSSSRAGAPKNPGPITYSYQTWPEPSQYSAFDNTH